jgi:hypothetical protein
MLKMFSIFSIVLFYICLAFGQTVNIQIFVHDNAAAGANMWFGLDLTATDGIDPALGESDLPPPPPGNAFDTRWWIPPFLGALSSMKDYRAPGNPPAFPFSGEIQHSIKFQTTDYPVTVVWSLPPQIQSTSVIQDVFGGVLVNKAFFGNDSVVVTNPGIAQLHVFVDYLDIVPVELTSFTAVLVNEEVQLNWTTATEINNQGFDIERRFQQNNHWEKIGFVPGFGTTTEPRTYSFSDENIITGKYSYRLKQIDYDGTFEYSDELAVEVDFTPSDFNLSHNYPNPFNPTTTIQFQVPRMSNVSIKIYDMLGSEVRTLITGQVAPGKYSVEWNGLNDDGVAMSSGNYIYRLVTEGFVDSKQMILLK